MKIERIDNSYKTTTLEDFAEEHDLTMVVTNYSSPTMSRYTAHFKHCEIKESGILLSAYGDAVTELLAIVHYTNMISGKILVINAMDPKTRKEIKVPTLIMG